MTRVRSLELRLVAIPLVRPFRTSFGESTEKVCVIARIETDDALGWGECVSDVEPNFSEEWNDGAWNVIRDFLAPAMFACSRVAGWSAHILEQKRTGRLFRPSAKYVGPAPRSLQPA